MASQIALPVASPERKDLEGRLNRWSHGLAAGAALVLTPILVASHAERGVVAVVACAVYSLAIVALFAASAAAHSAREGTRAESVLDTLDHVAIFAAIAGSYTPIALVTIGGSTGWSVFAAQWGLAGVGMAISALVGSRFMWLKLAIYLGMGWMALIILPTLLERMAWPGLAWLFAGGVFYTGGVGFFLARSLPFSHPIWHVFVIAAAACHFVMVWSYL